MKMPKLVICCNKCGKLASVDKEKSTENWEYYNMKEPCTCGGMFRTHTEEKRAKLLAAQN